MATGRTDLHASLLEFFNANTDLLVSRHACPDHTPDRRNHTRLEPTEEVTLRLDVLGGIWSAKVKEISNESACLHLDREIAHRIEDGEPASIWLESRRGTPIRLDGSLQALRTPAGTGPDEFVPVSFACEPQSLIIAQSAEC